MDSIVINGGKELKGSVSASGAKNAVLPMMVASLLADGKTTLTNVPKLRDTITMASLVEITGAEIELDFPKITIDSTGVNNPEAPYELVKTMRASFYILGPILARFGKAKVSLPGGCAWGPRPVDFHLKALNKMGVSIRLEGGYVLAEVSKLRGTNIRFDFPSVGATGNVLMAAVTAQGTTTIENAAMEPEIVQLSEMLKLMGADIEGIGTSYLTIHGVKELKPVSISIIPDRIEIGTFLIAGALLGEISVCDTIPSHLTALIEKLKMSGAQIDVSGNEITISTSGNLSPVDLTTAVYPGFPTDLQAQWIACMAVSKGSSVITDTVYHDRFSHVPELNRLGANIKIEHNSAFVRGVKSLKGAPVMSTDIRASASLILGGLVADGKTTISRVYHIDRGYEHIVNKFQSLGADIQRIQS
jgi:UDP-N-acetylglucosamine 1-carboxyvinyltransferase